MKWILAALLVVRSATACTTFVRDEGAEVDALAWLRGVRGLRERPAVARAACFERTGEAAHVPALALERYVAGPPPLREYRRR